MYTCVAVDDKSRIAYVTFDAPFCPQITLGSFLAIVNCRLSLRGQNISVNIPQASKVINFITLQYEVTLFLENIQNNKVHNCTSDI